MISRQSKHPHELPQNMHYVITYVTEMREHVPCTVSASNLIRAYHVEKKKKQWQPSCT